MPVRLATFNIENLMRRFDFSGYRKPNHLDRTLALYEIDDKEQYRQLEQARAIAQTDDNRQLTALALATTRADIVCLQEVDDLDALSAFEYNYLYRMVGRGYRHKYVSLGNDTRGIDVAIMARDETETGEAIEILETRTHAALTFGEAGVLTPELEARGHAAEERVFRRDCLQVELRAGGKPLTLFVVHFKSMSGPRDDAPGRDGSMPMRVAEAKAVRKIVTDRFGSGAASASWAICGDCNDYRERVIVGGGDLDNHSFNVAKEDDSALNVFLEDGFAVNPVERRSELDRWTLFHSRGPKERHLCQLDYILLSPSLADANSRSVPDIVRAGQPWRTPFPPGQEPKRFPRIGWDRPKASDHCPVAMTLALP
jgi:predicted extracellular nuclease